MIDERERFEDAFELFDRPEPAWDRLIRRRDRKRRNQRIAAGLVGIAGFVAAVWIVASGLSLDRSENSVAPAGDVTGPAETGPVGRPAPPIAHASAGPDVVEEGPCSDGARWRLVFTDTGTRIQVRFEVHRSPVGHEWLIHFRHVEHSFGGPRVRHVFFRGTAVASDSGVFVFQFGYQDYARNDGLKAKAVDRQTGQVCDAFAWYRD
jgi:hypothetical protein